MNTATLLLSCPDRKGIVAKISNFIFHNHGNIEHADQHIDSQTNTLFMRIEWSLKAFKIPRKHIKAALGPLAKEFDIRYSLHFSDHIPRMAIFVSRYMHCLYDILLRYQERHLRCFVPLIVGNHLNGRSVARHFKIPFFYFLKNQSNRLAVEKREINLLKQKRIDLIVLARYTYIFSKQFVETFPNRIINIHHSFLPAFVGKDPYEQAYARGVKIIGATSHYVTEQLDAGPIIEQDTARISHRDSLEDLKRKGEDLEKVVLSRAIRWHLEHKLLVYNNKTVVFD